MKTKVIFLIEKAEGNLQCNVFAYFPEDSYTNFENDVFTCYAHLGQHSACHIDYANECEQANYNEYYDLLRELIGQGYTNLQILNAEHIDCHRQPTKGEIKFGHGATHYRDFPIGTILKKDGNIKKWFIADDNLRYSTM